MIALTRTQCARFACALVLVAAMAPAPVAAAQVLAERVNQILERRGIGVDALRVIDNLITHEAPPPPAAPDQVRALLKDPLAAVNVAMLFDQAVPVALRRLADAAMAPPHRMDDANPVNVTDLLTPYLHELAAAQGLLRAAAKGRLDTGALLGTLASRSPSADDLRAVMRAVDSEMLARANVMFIDATARFIAALRARQGTLRFPQVAMRFESPIGAVVIGTRGDDAHAADAALIIDPGGNDTYTRAPTTGGAVSVIVDLGGNDRYTGADVVVHGLSAIVDLGGNDRYTTSGAGQGAALAGVSLILDFAGDDSYEAGFFAQGAAAFGLGAIIDVEGNDNYRIQTSGQGYGMAGGVGVLWDRAGNDSYLAAGLADAFARGGGISAAQGAAYGYRTSLGGGIGILRDDTGDDSYTAEMFAQGMGYYYGIGILWDRGGNDRYHAVRYAQGSGVHEAVGVLRDESGNDRYTATVGVAQGMGLDLAVGVLYDGAGDDTYRGGVLVQGAATSNGIGLLIDAGGADQWHADSGWGDAEWARDLPTLGLMLHDPSRPSSPHTYTHAEKPFTPAPESDRLGGPLARLHRPAAAPVAPPSCPIVAADTMPVSVALADALSRITPGLAGGTLDAAAYTQVLRRLTTQLRASIAELPGDDFNTFWPMGRVLECAAHAATAQEIELMWVDIEHVLNTDQASPFAGALSAVLRLRPPPVSRRWALLKILASHPDCSVRAGALRLRESAAGGNSGNAEDGETRDQLTREARAALENPCWRIQIAARDVLKKLNIAFDPNALPVFLREGVLTEPDERKGAAR